MATPQENLLDDISGKLMAFLQRSAAPDTQAKR